MHPEISQTVVAIWLSVMLGLIPIPWGVYCSGDDPTKLPPAHQNIFALTAVSLVVPVRLQFRVAQSHDPSPRDPTWGAGPLVQVMKDMESERGCGKHVSGLFVRMDESYGCEDESGSRGWHARRGPHARLIRRRSGQNLLMS
jgi:hypothetical protein